MVGQRMLREPAERVHDVITSASLPRVTMHDHRGPAVRVAGSLPQYTRFSSPTSSIPCAYGRVAG